MSLLFDLLAGVFVDPIVEYFYHDLTLGRILARLVATVALLAGMYLALLQPARCRTSAGRS